MLNKLIHRVAITVIKRVLFDIMAIPGIIEIV